VSYEERAGTFNKMN